MLEIINIFKIALKYLLLLFIAGYIYAIIVFEQFIYKTDTPRNMSHPPIQWRYEYAIVPYFFELHVCTINIGSNGIILLNYITGFSK